MLIYCSACLQDINVRVPSVKGHHSSGLMRTTIQPDNCWKLQQVRLVSNSTRLKSLTLKLVLSSTSLGNISIFEAFTSIISILVIAKG